MERVEVEALVIGAGPGGYVAGIRLGQLKVKALVVERDARPGGVCLNVGCIPSKALITAAKQYAFMRQASSIGLVADGVRLEMGRLQGWKEEIVGKLTSGVRQLLKANGCDYRTGVATFRSPHEVEVRGAGGELLVAAQHVVIATGSQPISLPHLPVDGVRVLDSTGALALREVPGSLVVIGGGYIGVEIGTLYAKLGARVTIVEATGALLPGVDPDLVGVVARRLRKLGVEVHLGTQAAGLSQQNGHTRVDLAGPGGELSVAADRVLVTVGRRPSAAGLGLERIGLEPDARGFLTVDDRQRTAVAGVYAIGDVARPPLLAHKAFKEGEVVAEVIAGRPAAFDVRAIPAVVYSDPEIATVGLTEADAERAGRTVAVGRFPFVANGRALAALEPEGFVKIVRDADSGELLGYHAVGPDVSDLLAEGTLAIELGALAQDVALTIHAHPTLAEATMEAAKASLGEAIHIQNR
ncbi:MAG TPA: dihydrolipoyl dehydrogenase [Polyangia bacterium]